MVSTMNSHCTARLPFAVSLLMSGSSRRFYRHEHNHLMKGSVVASSHVLLSQSLKVDVVVTTQCIRASVPFGQAEQHYLGGQTMGGC